MSEKIESLYPEMIERVARAIAKSLEVPVFSWMDHVDEGQGRNRSHAGTN